MSSNITVLDSVLHPFQNSSDVDAYRLQICVTCLATDCKMYFVKEGLLFEVFKALVDQSSMSMVCWECLARLRCAARLQQRAQTAQQLLKVIYQKFNNVNIENVKSLDRREHQLCSELGINTEFLNIYPQDDIKTEKEINKGDDTPPLSFDSYKPDTVGNEPLMNEANIKHERVSDGSNEIFYDVPLFDCFAEIVEEKCRRGRPKKYNKETSVMNKDVKTGGVAMLQSAECFPDTSKRKVDNSVGKDSNECQKGEVGPRNEIEKLMSTSFEITKFKHFEDKPFGCDLCSYQSSQKGNLKQHMLTHTGKKKFRCELCSFKCVRNRGLKRHMLTHTGEKPFSCDFCSYKCRASENLKKHKQIHTGEKPYSCEFCPYKCRESGSLKNHLRIHTGNKPFSCELCPYKCRVRGNLKKHMLLHTGEKPFSCKLCSYTCRESGNLKKHMIIHTGEKPLICELCAYKCSRSADLKRHMLMHTGENHSAVS